MNSFGKNLRVSTFGESHGPAMGGVIDGFPAGIKIDFDMLHEEIARRAPGSSHLVTQRKESDIPEILSGLTPDGITLGSPIGFIVRNQNSHSKDYSQLLHTYRPNHADFTYDLKFGIRDHRGGGRASARETVNWVIAGAFARQFLLKAGIKISALLSSAGKISFTQKLTDKLSLNPFETTCLSLSFEETLSIENEIKEARHNGDSIGGVVTCLITGVPGGLGSPVFDKFHSRLAQAMMSINAAKGFEYGFGFNSSEKKGSELLDNFYFDTEENKILTHTNFSGGIQGGISNSMPVYFNVAFKPTPTIFKEIDTVDDKGKRVSLKVSGRHDPCVAVRAVPVVEAMASLVIADFLL